MTDQEREFTVRTHRGTKDFYGEPDVVSVEFLRWWYGIEPIGVIPANAPLKKSEDK